MAEDDEAQNLIQRLEATREMMDRERRVYLAIGHFIVAFSQLEFTLRHLLAVRLKLDGALFDIVTSGYDFAMLCKVVRESYFLHYPQDKKRQTKIADVINQCLALSAHRNTIAHATWGGTDNGFAARPVSRNTLEPSYKFEDSSEIIAKAREAEQMIGKLFTVFGGLRGLK
jgi:hypothetical protein